jgi:hypothetical protein
MNTTGIVETIQTRETDYGTMYNAIVDGEWYGFGKNKPDAVVEGATISFDWTQKGKFRNVNGGTTKAVEGASADSAGRQPRAQSASVSQDARQASIVMQSSTTAATALLGVLLENEVFAMPTAKGKRFDVLMDIHDDLTAKFAARSLNPIDFLAERAAAPGVDSTDQTDIDPVNA